MDYPLRAVRSFGGIACDKLGVRSRPTLPSSCKPVGLKSLLLLGRLIDLVPHLNRNAEAPLRYDFLSVDPDVIRFAWSDRKDYIVVGLGAMLRAPEVATSIVSWLAEKITEQDTANTLAGARGESPIYELPDIVRELAKPVCNGGSGKPGSKRCGQCLACGFVLVPQSAFLLEWWLSTCCDVAPEIVNAAEAVGQDYVALWGPITITWTWDALVSLVDTDVSRVFDGRYLWRELYAYLALKSPQAALAALQARRYPRSITITKRDLVPLMQHPDHTVRARAFAVYGALFRASDTDAA